MFVLVCFRFFTKKIKKYSILIRKGKTCSSKFFGVVKCNLEYDYFVALMDVCSKDKFLGYDWCHLKLFLGNM